MGGGMQIPVIDIDGDGDLDIVCAGKSGLFFVENLTKGKRESRQAARSTVNPSDLPQGGRDDR